ncbi:MAG: hypothetical protein QXP42_01700 [Candidatus Micrarchaeia archaeon]
MSKIKADVGMHKRFGIDFIIFDNTAYLVECGQEELENGND